MYYKSSKEDPNISDESFTYEYIPWRGVTKETFQFYDTKTKIDASGIPTSLGYKYPNGSFKVRSLREKSFYSIGDIAKAGLFGKDKFDAGQSRYVTITEGELDACSLYQILKAPVCSVQSSTSAVRDCSVDLDWLRSFERVYLAFDADRAGQEAVRSVAKLFDYSRVYVVKLSRHKDANAYLEAGEGDELKKVWWNSKKYLPDTVISSLQEFKDILQEPVKTGVSYPFPTLTKMTYGIRTGETVLITAQEKVGKTELMHAIEHHLLKETDDAIAAIFLEEPRQRHLQALAGAELQRPAHLPDSGCSPDELVSALERLLQKDERLFLYNHYGSDDPAILLDTIRFLVNACGCRYVLLDHITMVLSGLKGEDERRGLDYLSTRLEMMVKELDFALIMVSHVNDSGQTRGSHLITKVADITINATRNTLHLDPIERHTVYLTIPYNRFSSNTGPAGRLKFNPETYLLTEIEDASSSDGKVLFLEESPPIQWQKPEVFTQVGVGD